MKQILILMLFVKHLLASSSFPSDVEMFGFNGESIKMSRNSDPNEKRVDNIFKLLSGLSFPEDIKERHFGNTSPLLITASSKYHDDETVDENKTNNYIEVESGFKLLLHYSPLLKKCIQMANRLSESGSAASDVIEDVVSTVKKVTTIYRRELQKKTNKSNSMVLVDKNPMEEGIMKLTSNIINNLLLPANMEKIYESGMHGTSEDEILEQLVSVIVGAEDRGGGYGGHGDGHYGLTKDPITIIALLALAAFLIRAAIEFLRAANGKRSVELLSYPEVSQVIPEIISSVYEMIFKAQVKYESPPLRGKEMNEMGNTTWTSSTFDILKLLNLMRSGNKSCFRKYLCEHFVGKSVSEFEAIDAAWIGVGLYSGDQEVMLEAYNGADVENLCERHSPLCHPKVGQPEKCISCPSNFLNGMRDINGILHFLPANNFGFGSLLSYWT